MFPPEEMEIKLSGKKAKDHSVTINPGWNFVGVSEEQDYPEDSELGNSIWRWDLNQQKFHLVTRKEKLGPGTAYWIYSNKTVTLFE